MDNIIKIALFIVKIHPNRMTIYNDESQLSACALDEAVSSRSKKYFTSL
jgi:hypothetical protein